MKLIVTDLDGTLLNSKKEIGTKDREMIQKLQQTGHYFTFATSRYYKSIKFLFHDLNISAPIITSNGSLIYDPINDKVLSCNFISKEIIKKLKTYALENNYPFIAQTVEQMYVSKDHPRIQVFKQRNLEIINKTDWFFPCEESFDSNKIEVFQFSVRTNKPHETFEQIETLLQGEKTNVLLTGDDIVVITPDISSKANGIKKVQEYYDISLNDVIVFGDEYNDSSMFDYSIHSVAMGNAISEIKEKAEFVTKTNEECGVSYALKHFYNL